MRCQAASLALMAELNREATVLTASELQCRMEAAHSRQRARSGHIRTKLANSSLRSPVTSQRSHFSLLISPSLTRNSSVVAAAALCRAAIAIAILSSHLIALSPPQQLLHDSTASPHLHRSLESHGEPLCRAWTSPLFRRHVPSPWPHRLHPSFTVVGYALALP